MIMSMQYSDLGRSGLRVSRVALGAMNFGMTTDEAVSHRILDEALERGINVVDTAEVYGGPQSADMAQGYGISELGEEPANVALAWLLHQPAVTSAIIGPRAVEQVGTAQLALEITLDDDTVQRLDEIWPGRASRRRPTPGRRSTKANTEEQ